MKNIHFKKIKVVITTDEFLKAVSKAKPKETIIFDEAQIEK